MRIVILLVLIGLWTKGWTQTFKGNQQLEIETGDFIELWQEKLHSNDSMLCVPVKWRLNTSDLDYADKGLFLELLSYTLSFCTVLKMEYYDIQPMIFSKWHPFHRAKYLNKKINGKNVPFSLKQDLISMEQYHDRIREYGPMFSRKGLLVVYFK